jgi:thiol-disulfide isomerase/thioredoxin
MATVGRLHADAVPHQTAPGIGANTEDPRKILRAAAEALRAVRNVTYDVRYRGIGAFATRTATVIGKASLAKLPAGDPLVAKLAAEGTFYQSGTAEAVAFHTAFDGKVVRKLSTKTHLLVERDVTADPKGRTLGGVTMLFGGGAYQATMFEYIQDAPLARQLEATVAEYDGRTNIVGVLCHVVYLEYAFPNGRVKRERWFLGVRDNLPREFEDVAVDDNGRYGAYVMTLSNLRVNRPLDALDFSVKLPAGYTIKPYEEPNRPELLGVGEPAPDWTLMDEEGEAHRLADYRGKLVVLDFWATWCGPCVQGMPGMQSLHEKYRARGVEIIGINAWEESNAAAYMKEKGYTYRLLLKGDTVAEAYRANALPTIYVIGIDGRIIYRGTSTGPAVLAALIDQALKAR